MGEVFAGRYELLDLIGQGGMGSVWRVHDRRTDEVVAAKVLRQSDAASLLRFVRETALRIQHPHVVTPLGWAGEDDRVLFTMPIVDGGSVATLVGDHGPLPAPFVAEVLRQVLDGLTAVHASGVVHRDVKPANILLRATVAERPHAYLTDFGIALELDGPRLTRTDAALGTPGYMAPEQLRGEVTTATDLYALGAVALEMLTAERPAESGLGARPDGVPDVLLDLVGDLRSEDPAARPDAPTARARLEVPELTWHPGAAGEVEVLRQVEGDPRVDSPVADQPASVAVTPPIVTPPPEVSPHDPPSPVEPPRRPSSVRHALIAAAAAGVSLLVILAVLLVWSPWDRSGGTGSSDHTSRSEIMSSSVPQGGGSYAWERREH